MNQTNLLSPPVLLVCDIDGVFYSPPNTTRKQDLVSNKAKELFPGVGTLTSKMCDIAATHFFSKEALTYLDLLIQEIQKTREVQILVSSAWGLNVEVEELQETLKLRSFSKYIVDKIRDRGGSRGDKIQAWLEAHPAILDYLIFDDIDDDLSKFKHRFIKVDSTQLFNQKILEKALEVLKIHMSDELKEKLKILSFASEKSSKSAEILQMKGFSSHPILVNFDDEKRSKFVEQVLLSTTPEQVIECPLTQRNIVNKTEIPPQKESSSPLSKIILREVQLFTGKPLLSQAKNSNRKQSILEQMRNRDSLARISLLGSQIVRNISTDSDKPRIDVERIDLSIGAVIERACDHLRKTGSLSDTNKLLVKKLVLELSEPFEISDLTQGITFQLVRALWKSHAKRFPL